MVDAISPFYFFVFNAVKTVHNIVKSQAQPYAFRDWVTFPDSVQGQGSLTPLEKMLLGNVILLERPRLIVELGVLHAVTTQFICAFLEENDIDASVVGFDLQEVVARLRKENAAVQHYEEVARLELIPGRLPTSLEQWLHRVDQPIDLAFVDATHDYRSVTAELQLLWPRLAPDGCILCHDYSEKYDGVRHAVDRFGAKMGARVLPLTSSARAEKHGYSSVLVALRRKTFEPTLRSKAHHRWKKMKIDLLGYSVINKAWHQVLKPLVLRGTNEK